MPTLIQPKLDSGGSSSPPIRPSTPRGGGNNGNNDGDISPSGMTARFAIYLGMVGSTMTFLALVTAMIVRRGLAERHEWHRVPVSPLLWWNTAALLLSSLAIDLGRRAFLEGRRPRFRAFWLIGTALGTWFLIGQVIAWSVLADHGFYMQRNPASAFFYVLTWVHAAHVIGALAALYYVACRALFFRFIPMNRNVLEVSAIFWHFLDIMWLLLMAVFVFWA